MLSGTGFSMEVVDKVPISPWIDQDCCNDDNKSLRTSSEDHEIAKIAKDLLDQHVFQRMSGREGHPSFPKFERSLLHCLDYRDLLKWIKDDVELWGTIYE